MAVMSQLPVITAPSSGQGLSKTQRQFNEKIKQIELLKGDLARLEAAEQQLRQSLAKKFQPLRRQIQEQLCALVEAFDYGHGFFKLNREEKNTLKEMIQAHLRHLEQLLQEENFPESIQAIYQKYQAPKRQETAESVSETYFDEEAKNTSASQSPDAGLYAKTSKSLFNRLSKSLHPDLEPDETKKEEKTALMHEINEAYRNKDFFTLLQLHHTHIASESPLAQSSEEEMQLYIARLEAQIESLQAQKTRRLYFNFSPLMQYAESPKQLKKKSREALEELKNIAEALSQQLRIAHDTEGLKMLVRAQIQYEKRLKY